MNSILIVDDEPGIRETLRGVLEDEGFAVDLAATGEECLKLVEENTYSCILLDIWLGKGIDGLNTLKKLREEGNDSAVIMISGHGNIESAVKSTKLGAFDFIEKPLSLERTIVTVKNAVRQRELERANEQLQQELADEYVMVGESIAMRALRKQISIVAPSDGRVLISGESGTGKELVARAIHSQSKRKNSPFVEINSAAIPEELVESELFGHSKGAFSGANSAKKGKFEIADGATLFLDEIGDMSSRVQAKMLRVLEEQRFEPVGSNKPIKVDVRVISATNKRLDELIENGNFRHDLFYRLNVIPFQVPPLRERLEDVPALIDHFNRKFSSDNGKKVKVFTEAAIEKLSNHIWPGNVRELRNTIERVIIMTTKQKIDVGDLPELGFTEEKPSSSFRFPSFKEATDAYQREFILHKLAEFDGNVSKAAEDMGVDRSHLYRRMRNLGIHGR
ncbi:sigma-54-dependent transcriptional regulator [Leptolyngbya sp. 7M]|uniref:sigma-54-dependent transcriptional regulator n=1 Tax=Leptolyngbya sp. 7M TaxID=2812896 RepID=UPI001B8C0C1A|nr:sigma-54 dependent transcriptional regulator [Leptolyngbya sp. 7M]QYO66132.1 sigma-54 dependent transcriptional regulator [Leptolyngbya sp. 7M]